MKRPSLGLILALMAPPALATAGEFTVAQSEIGDRKIVFATVESVDVFDARARIGGTVGSLLVDEGSKVAGGEKIAVVDDPKLALQLAAVDARIRSLGAQRKLALTELKRVTRLRASGATSQARLDEARTNLDVIASNQAAMQAERAVIAERLSEGAVLAPGTGRVLRVHVAEGSVVMPGEPIATIAAERYVLRLELPERHARFIGEGDEILVAARGLSQSAGDTPRVGVIRKVYPLMTNGRVVADAEVEGLGDYFVGERIRVHVVTGKRPAILVPAEYLTNRYGVTYATVRDEGAVMVQPGRAYGENVEVLSGLKPGDVLVEP